MENQRLIDELVSVLKQVASYGHTYHCGVRHSILTPWEDCGWTSCRMARDAVEKVTKAEQVGQDSNVLTSHAEVHPV